MGTLVEIDLYMPMSFTDHYYVETDDRGEAVRKVLAQYDAHTLRYVNLIHARLRDNPHLNPDNKSRTLPKILV